LPALQWLPPCFFISHVFLFSQLLSQGSTDVPAFLAEVTQLQEATTNAEAACVMAMLTTETSTQEADVARDSAALRVKDAEYQATLAERVSRAEAENVVVLASTREDADCFVWKITLLVDELVAER
jgi:hypothetical protein